MTDAKLDRLEKLIADGKEVLRSGKWIIGTLTVFAVVFAVAFACGFAYSQPRIAELNRTLSGYNERITELETLCLKLNSKLRNSQDNSAQPSVN